MTTPTRRKYQQAKNDDFAKRYGGKDATIQPTPIVPPPPRKGRYELHCEKWSGGCGSEICEGAARVFGKGVLPCEVLFIGEAPGESEDVLGRPFCGPAGHLLDHMVKQALPDGVRCAYTNLVCCIPRTEAGGKAGEPPDEAIRQCQPRLVELLEMARPKIVVCVGKLSGDFVEEDTAGAYRYALRLPDTVKRVVVLHPAAILRANPAHKGLLQQKWIVQVRNAYYDKVEESDGDNPA